ncbi:MAG TPA: AI-2E family transporter, partial [Bacteroidia bacterium]|nr:AI-2E family transporter [Bacteroidia bacterium]
MNSVRNNVVTGILIVVGLVLLAVLCVAIWYLRLLFLYVIIAAILTLITRPLEKLLERIKFGKRKIPRGLRAVTVLLSIYLVIFIFIAIFIPLFMNEGKILANVDTTKLTTALHEPISQLDSLFRGFQHGNDKQSLEQYVQHVSSDMLNATQLSSLANGITNFVKSLFVA